MYLYKYIDYTYISIYILNVEKYALLGTEPLLCFVNFNYLLAFIFN